MEVYWNLHKNKFSVRNKGIVVQHLDTVFMRNVKFVVRPAGRAKVLLDQKKNVHAFVRGEINPMSLDYMRPFDRAKYNPYTTDTFVSCMTGEAIYEADLVWMVSPNGKPLVYFRSNTNA